MKAIQANLLQFLYRSDHFEIPIYQRPYSWTLPNWKQFWDDITRLAENRNLVSHFLGPIVYAGNQTSHISSINTCQLIDGGQRLITVSLLLAALNKALKESNIRDEVIIRKIDNYLFNESGEGYQRYKLELNPLDKETYAAILDEKPDLPINYSENIKECFEFFETSIRESETSYSQILSSLLKLTIVDIALQPEIDDSQLIYNSLNSSGLSLSQLEQIRNHILIGLDKSEQNQIYNNYWLPMELEFNSINCSGMFEKFIRDYLSIHNNTKTVSLNEIYVTFKKFFQEKSKFKSCREIIKHMYLYTRYYIKLVLAEEPDTQIRNIIESLNNLGAENAYPFLMEVYDDYENNLIDRNTFIEILNTVENYLIKLPSNNNLNNDVNVFATLSKDISKMLAHKDLKIKISDLPVEEVTEITQPDNKSNSDLMINPLTEAKNKGKNGSKTINSIQNKTINNIQRGRTVISDEEETIKPVTTPFNNKKRHLNGSTLPVLLEKTKSLEEVEELKVYSKS